MQLDIFSQLPLESNLRPGKPHKDISIQKDGKVLYRGNIGWFSDKKVAIEYGYTPPPGYEHL